MWSTLLLVAFATRPIYSVLIPAPDGPFSVAMSVASLTDDQRLDPYAPHGNPHQRSIVVSTFLPAKGDCQLEISPYMTPLVAEEYDTSFGAAVGAPGIFSNMEMQACNASSPSTRPAPCRWSPLVLFSPGGGNPRLLYGALARFIASRGYAVISIDHPYDASIVEFPDGSVVKAANISDEDPVSLSKATSTRAADISFLLDRLQGSEATTVLPKNFINAVNLHDIIVIGHSLGGAAAATAMLKDERVLGGIDFDGRLTEPVQSAGLDGPFIIAGRPDHIDEDPTWAPFLSQLRGPRALLEVEGSTHGSFTDFPILLDALNLSGPVKEALHAQLGSVEWSRMAPIITAIVSGLVDYTLGASGAPPILTGGSASFPEVLVSQSGGFDEA